MATPVIDLKKTRSREAALEQSIGLELEDYFLMCV
jgi:hypothetical protein